MGGIGYLLGGHVALCRGLNMPGMRYVMCLSFNSEIKEKRSATNSHVGLANTLRRNQHRKHMVEMHLPRNALDAVVDLRASCVYAPAHAETPRRKSDRLLGSRPKSRQAVESRCNAAFPPGDRSNRRKSQHMPKSHSTSGQSPV